MKTLALPLCASALATPAAHAAEIQRSTFGPFELWSNQPGLQFYSGNFLNSTSSGKAKKVYRAVDAIVMEPQIFPDTPNRPAFGSARLALGETYRNVMTYRLTTGQTC